MSAELDRFLECQRNEGRYFDSSHFSIDSLRAREKLARYQLPEPGLWLVKMVQAAVALGAAQIQLHFGTRRVRVSFTPALPLQADDLLAQVLAGTLPESDGLLHLVTGIRSSASEVTETVSWSCGGSQVTLAAQGTSVTASAGAGFQLVATRPPRTRSLRATLVSPISHLLRQTVEEYQSVANRCWPCPIPIEIDGKRLRTGYNSPHARGLQQSPWEAVMQHDKTRQNVVQACLGLRHLEPFGEYPPLPILNAPLATTLTRMLYKDETFLNWARPEAPSSAAVIAVEHRYQCHSQVDFVWDGAVVASTPLDWSVTHVKFLGMSFVDSQNIGVRCIFAVTRDQLDLSQFAVRDQKSLTDQRVAQVLSHVVELLEEIRSRVGKMYYLPVRADNSKYWGVGLLTPTASALIALGGPALVPAGAIGVVAMLSVWLTRRALQSDVDGLLRTLCPLV